MDGLPSLTEIGLIHLGIIMDGNGRWAKLRGLNRSQGHQEGLNAAKVIAKAARDLGLKYLTLYVFSTENWKRAEEEVNFLMFLLKKYLKAEYKFYAENQIRVLHSGNIEALPKEVQKEIQEVQEQTSGNQGLVINLAINYGGRDEVIRAFNRYQKTGSTEFLREENFSSFFDVPELPPADLIIRTGGDQRLSNFLLWHGAYAELYFSDKLWPDWNPDDLKAAVMEFQKRHRKFGGVSE